MKVAKIINGQISQVAECHVFSDLGSAPTDQQLTNGGYLKCNLWKPHDRLTHKLQECTPYIEGNWVYLVEVVALTQEEIDAAKARALSDLKYERTQRLSLCDWTQVDDCPLRGNTEWLAYRQALRDLPENTADPRVVTWPVAPDASSLI